MLENLAGDGRFLDARDDLDGPAAMLTDGPSRHPLENVRDVIFMQLLSDVPRPMSGALFLATVDVAIRGAQAARKR
jgi:hypothetical protein